MFIAIVIADFRARRDASGAAGATADSADER
jgi:hypothetical protein